MEDLTEKSREIIELYFGSPIPNEADELTPFRTKLGDVIELVKAGFEAGKQERDLPDIELVSAKVHEAWIESKKAQGVTSRKSEKGEELMVPYGDLSEEAKDLDRVTVKTVYKALENLSK